MMKKRTAPGLNVIFLGGFPYPRGMAGTKRIQHAIDGLKDAPDVSIRVIVLSQSSKNNVLNGTHRGIRYITVMGDLLRWRMALLFPLFYLKARRALKRAYRPGCDNIIYNYGPPNLFNVGVLAYARRLGYQVVVDVVEDYDVAMTISRSVIHRIKMAAIQHLKQRVKRLASGIIVISSCLGEKYRELTLGAVPIHYRPISVDFSFFAGSTRTFGKIVTLFYAGSFGQKDGVPVLLDAFDCIAERRPNVRLVLTGKGSDEMMRSTLSRIAASPFKQRIEYKGYLDDDAYYAALSAADIPCMTRIDSAYARAGFPFKLGEFLATGQPVVASRVSDVADLLKDQEDAMLVSPGNPQDVVRAVEYLLDNPDFALAVGVRGRATARRLFDLREQGRDLVAFLRTLSQVPNWQCLEELN